MKKLALGKTCLRVLSIFSCQYDSKITPYLFWSTCWCYQKCECGWGLEKLKHNNTLTFFIPLRLRQSLLGEKRPSNTTYLNTFYRMVDYMFRLINQSSSGRGKCCNNVIGWVELSTYSKIILVTCQLLAMSLEILCQQSRNTLATRECCNTSNGKRQRAGLVI
jgi:hypothetical protein